jgi:hypothetical protein
MEDFRLGITAHNHPGNAHQAASICAPVRVYPANSETLS